MERYYTDISEVMAGNGWYEGMIVTGAPLEHLSYEEVRYWNQLKEVYAWGMTHVGSTLNICWGAFAALKMFFGIDKHWTQEKLFGVYPHKALHREVPLMSGMPAEVMVPISRHITLWREELEAVGELTILLDHEVTGPELAMAWGGRHVFATGHMEYAEGRLRFEYERDMAKGLPIGVPANYFKNDDPAQGVVVSWQETGRLFYRNWALRMANTQPS